MSRHDDVIDPAGSFTVSDARPLLYQADGTPLKRQIGFCMQTSGTAPGLSDGTKKTITTKAPRTGKK